MADANWVLFRCGLAITCSFCLVYFGWSTLIGLILDYYSNAYGLS